MPHPKWPLGCYPRSPPPQWKEGSLATKSEPLMAAACVLTSAAHPPPLEGPSLTRPAVKPPLFPCHFQAGASLAGVALQCELAVRGLHGGTTTSFTHVVPCGQAHPLSPGSL